MKFKFLLVLILVVFNTFATKVFYDSTKTGGSDDGSDADNAYLLFQSAIDNVGAGDSVIINSGIRMTASIDFDGANNAYFIGASASVIDTNRQRVYGTGLTDLVATFSSTGITIQNLWFDSVGVADDYFNASGQNAYFINCLFRYCKDAVFVNTGIDGTFYDCIFDGNVRGFQFYANGTDCERCVFCNHTQYAIDWYNTDNGSLRNCLFYNNPVSVKTIDDNNCFFNVTVDGDSSASVADTGLIFVSTSSGCKIGDCKYTNLDVAINGADVQISFTGKSLVFNSEVADFVNNAGFHYMTDSTMTIDPDEHDGYVDRAANNYNSLSTATNVNDTIPFPGY